MSYCWNMIVLISFPFKVWVYYGELGNSIFMCTISPIMGNALRVCRKSLTTVWKQYSNEGLNLVVVSEVQRRKLNYSCLFKWLALSVVEKNVLFQFHSKWCLALSEVRAGCSGVVHHFLLVWVTPSLGFPVWEAAVLCASTGPEGEERAN